MKFKFLLNWEGRNRGEVVELSESDAADLLTDGVVERFEAEVELPKIEVELKPVKPEKKKLDK